MCVRMCVCVCASVCVCVCVGGRGGGVWSLCMSSFTTGQYDAISYILTTFLLKNYIFIVCTDNGVQFS